MNNRNIWPIQSVLSVAAPEMFWCWVTAQLCTALVTLKLRNVKKLKLQEMKNDKFVGALLGHAYLAFETRTS